MEETYAECWDWLKSTFSGTMVSFVWDSETSSPTAIIFIGRLLNKSAVFCSGKTIQEVKEEAEKRLYELTR